MEEESDHGEALDFGLLSVQAAMAEGGKAGLGGLRYAVAGGWAQEVHRHCHGGFWAPDLVRAASKHQMSVGMTSRRRISIGIIIQVPDSTGFVSRHWAAAGQGSGL